MCFSFIYNILGLYETIDLNDNIVQFADLKAQRLQVVIQIE